METLIVTCEQNAAAALSRLSDDEPPLLLDLTPLKVKAMTVLSRTINGLVLLSLVHHLSCMQDAVKDAHFSAGKWQDKTKDLMKNVLENSYIPEQYEEVFSSLKERLENPFYRELYKIMFHAQCAAEIRNRFIASGL